MTVTGHTAVFAVVGHPVAHSRSPELHGRWLREHGVDGVYVALPAPPDRAAHLVDALRTLRLAGVNLTVPFKEAVLPHLDALDPAAQALGAVNTVVRAGDRLVGHNTDAHGYVDGLIAEHGDVVTGAHALILGAGGAGRAVGLGLALRGARRVTWLNRTPTRAAAVVETCRRASPAVTADSGPLDGATFLALAPAVDLVVVATSGPAAEVLCALDPGALPRHAVWSDLNYWMPDPPGMSTARRHGLRTQDGLPMLVHQAARAFSLFTGHLPDAEATLRSLR